jgi:hypothetical protein
MKTTNHETSPAAGARVAVRTHRGPARLPALGTSVRRNTMNDAVRAPGYTVPRYVRLLAIRTRMDSRPGFWLAPDRPRAYTGLNREFAAAFDAPFPAPRTRISSSVRILSQSSSTWHSLVLSVIDARYCPWPCERCETHLALDVDEWAYNHERDARVMAGGAR